MTGSRPPLSGALVGAGTLLGQELRRQLAAGSLPLPDLVMMAAGDDVGQILEVAGEARLVTEVDEDRLARVDVLFLAERGGAARRALAAAAAGPAVVIDLVDAGAGTAGPVVNMAVNPRDLPGARPAGIRAPHQAAQALSSAVSALAGGATIQRVEATVLTPASDAGEAGVEELYRQTAGVLNFSERPTGIFERQAAFNIIPHALMSRQHGWPDLDSRIRDELSAILGLPPGAVAVRALLAPVFHGLAMAVSLVAEGLPPAAERRRLLAEAGFGTDPVTPAELGEGEVVHVADLGEEDGGRLGLWMVADNVRGGLAVNAVSIARAMLEPSRAAAPGARAGEGGS